jgi:hypothetical protein
MSGQMREVEWLPELWSKSWDFGEKNRDYSKQLRGLPGRCEQFWDKYRFWGDVAVNRLIGRVRPQANYQIISLFFWPESWPKRGKLVSEPDSNAECRLALEWT